MTVLKLRLLKDDNKDEPEIQFLLNKALLLVHVSSYWGILPVYSKKFVTLFYKRLLNQWLMNWVKVLGISFSIHSTIHIPLILYKTWAETWRYSSKETWK